MRRLFVDTDRSHMNPDEVKARVEAGIPNSEVVVNSDGSHFELTVISSTFDGLSMVDEQRLVYAALADEIASGAIHAINIKAYTPDEWKSFSQLRVS